LGSKSDTAIVTERLLSISGNDLLTVDRKHMAPWSGYLPTRFVLLSNELPRFKDSSGALPSRFMIMVMSQSFYGRENTTLTDELCEELPSIFNWSLDGLARLCERGRFEQTEAGKDAVSELEDMASPISAFVRDCCEVDANKWAEVDMVYEAYQIWC